MTLQTLQRAPSNGLLYFRGNFKKSFGSGGISSRFSDDYTLYVRALRNCISNFKITFKTLKRALSTMKGCNSRKQCLWEWYFGSNDKSDRPRHYNSKNVAFHRVTYKQLSRYYSSRQVLIENEEWSLLGLFLIPLYYASLPYFVTPCIQGDPKVSSRQK